MTHISSTDDIATIINVFTVEPAKQDALVELLTRATDETIRHMPGFISANCHKSTDGTRVANYAQWRSREDLEAMLRHPAAMPHLREASALAIAVDPHVYDVVAVRETAHALSRARRIALGAAATGAVALGAFAVGALAIGSLAIGAIAVKRAVVRKLSIEDVTIGRLNVRELLVQQG
jgi:heme-degrading monooxygenase HmoA